MGLLKNVMAVAATALATSFTATVASADDWPSKPVTITVPFGAGGSADRVARNLAPFLEKELGQPVVVENRKGASGQIGTMTLLAQPADGYNILMHAQPYMSASIELQGAKFGVGDLDIINVQGVGNISLTVKAESPYDSFDDLHKAILANPGKISVGTVRGGSPHLLTLLLVEKLGWDIRIVTYDSGAPLRTAVLGGQIDVSTNGAVSDAAMKPEIRSLALSTSQSLSVFKGVPSVNEAVAAYGVDLPEIGDARFFSVKAGTAEAHADRFATLVAAFEAAMQNPDYIAILAEQGALEETSFRGPDASTKVVEDMHSLMSTYKSAFSN